jgi:hypothetical protein
VIIHDLDFVCIPVAPDKTKTPLVVNANTVLPLPLAAQGFQTVPRRCCQVAQLHSAVQLAKLSAGGPFHGSKAAALLAVVKPPGFRAAERPDHPSIVLCYAFNVNRYKVHGWLARLYAACAGAEGGKPANKLPD